MTVSADVWLRGQNHATTVPLDGVVREPQDWTDDDVRAVLEGMLRAMNRMKNPAAEDGPVTFRGLSWIVNPFEGGVVIAIEITLGAAIAGPFDIEAAALESVIKRLIGSAATLPSTMIH